MKVCRAITVEARDMEFVHDASKCDAPRPFTTLLIDARKPLFALRNGAGASQPSAGMDECTRCSLPALTQGLIIGDNWRAQPQCLNTTFFG